MDVIAACGVLSSGHTSLLKDLCQLHASVSEGKLVIVSSKFVASVALAAYRHYGAL